MTSELVTSQECSYCGETLENHGGYAWFHPRGLMLCDRTSPISETGDDRG